MSQIPPPRPEPAGVSTSPPQPPATAEANKHELDKIRYQGDVDLVLAESQADAELAKIEATSDFALNQAFHQGLMDVEKGSIDRALAGAESVRNAAAAVGVIYTGILGLAFSVGDRPLPLRGTIPALFLGLSIVLATAYMAYLTDPPAGTQWPEGARSTLENQRERTAAFIDWVGEKVRNRAYVLQASVAALGFGVAFLPVGFVALGSTPPGTAVATPSTTSTTTWPSPPEGIADAELRQALYEAQLEEAKDQHAAALRTKPSESFTNVRVQIVYGAAIVALLLVFLIPLLIKPRKAPPEAQSPPDRA